MERSCVDDADDAALCSSVIAEMGLGVAADARPPYLPLIAGAES